MKPSAHATCKALLAFYLVGIVLAMTACPTLASTQTWPTIELPENIHPTSVGEQITQNGLPMRVQVFMTKQSSSELATWFRASFGRRHVENKLGAATVFGRADGDFYISVQLTPILNGTRGIVAVSRIKTMAEASARKEPRSDAPGDSKVLSDTRSDDGSKTARHLIYTNLHTQEVNRELVSSFLKEKGYKLEREVKLEDKPGQTLFFRDGDREAIAVITRQGDKTAVVVNIASNIKQPHQ